MEVVNGALKPFNDGLYAAVELEVEAGKRQLFADAGDPARHAGGRGRRVDAAGVRRRGRPGRRGPDPRRRHAHASTRRCRQPRAERAAAFQADAARARPDRLLHLDPRAGARSSRATASCRTATTANRSARSPRSRSCSARTRRCSPTTSASTALYAGLTNPYISYPIDALIPYVPSAAALADPDAIESAFKAATPAREVCGVRAGRVPARVAQQGGRLLRRAVLQRPPGAGTNLLDVLIDGVRSGAGRPRARRGLGLVRLPDLRARDAAAARARAGEPEPAAHRRLQEEADRDLQVDPDPDPRDARQTAGRRCAAGVGLPPAPVDVYPLLPAEPFPTFYLRTARGYRFLRTFLQAALGPTFLAGTDARRRVGRSRRPCRSRPSSISASRCSTGWRSSRPTRSGWRATEGMLPDELAEIDVDAAVTAARGWLAAGRPTPTSSAIRA